MSKFFNKKVLIVLSVLLLSAVGAGGGIYWYYSQSPKKIIKNMVDKLLRIQSVEYSGSVQVITNQNQTDKDAPVAEAPIKKKLPENITLDFHGARQISSSTETSGVSFLTLSVNDPSDEENTIGLDIKIIDSVYYAGLQDQSQIKFFDLTPLKGFWVKIDSEALIKQFGWDKLEEKDQKEGENSLSKEKLADLKKSIPKNNFLHITKKLSSEIINGVETNHYQVSVDKEGMIEFLAEAAKTMQNNDTRPETMDKEIDKMKETLGLQEFLSGEIWIGKNDTLPYRLSFTLRTQVVPPSQLSIDYAVLLDFLNYNQPVVVETPKPEEVKTVEEMMASLFKKPALNPALMNQIPQSPAPPIPGQVGASYKPHEPSSN